MYSGRGSFSPDRFGQSLLLCQSPLMGQSDVTILVRRSARKGCTTQNETLADELLFNLRSELVTHIETATGQLSALNCACRSRPSWKHIRDGAGDRPLHPIPRH